MEDKIEEEDVGLQKVKKGQSKIQPLKEVQNAENIQPNHIDDLKHWEKAQRRSLTTYLFE